MQYLRRTIMVHQLYGQVRSSSLGEGGAKNKSGIWYAIHLREILLQAYIPLERAILKLYHFDIF